MNLESQPPQHPDGDPENTAPESDAPDISAREARRDQPTPQPRPEPLAPTQAVLERWEEGPEDTLYAILLVGEAETEHILPAHRIPRHTQPGDWFQVELDGDRITRLIRDEATTQTRRARIHGKRNRLKSRPRRFKDEG